MKLVVAALLLAVAACTSITEMDVGAGDIPQLHLRVEYYGLPQGEWVSDGALRWEADSTDVAIRTDPARTMVSAIREAAFLSAEEAAVAKDKLGDHAGAIEGIALQVLELTIEDPDTGEPLDERVASRALLDGAVLGPTGWKGRVALSAARKNQVLTLVQHQEPVSIPVGVDLVVAPGGGAALPAQARVRMTIQPILVVQTLKAL